MSDYGNDQWQQTLNELNLAYGEAVSLQASQLADNSGTSPNIDHPINLVKVKLLWHLGHHTAHFKINFKKLAIITSPLVVILLLFFTYSVFMSKNLGYNFASSNNCATSPLILPGLFGRTSTGNFDLDRHTTKVFGLKLYSSHICAKPLSGPKALTTYHEKEWLNLFGLKLSKTINVKTSGYTMANAPKLGTSAIPVEKPLQIKLTNNDLTFSYAIITNGHSAPCQKTNNLLSCNLSPLGLAYGTSYNIDLVRTFNNQVAGTVLSKTLQTITATAISTTSIAAGSTVYSQPTQLTITTSKALTKLDSLSLTYKNASGTSITVPITYSFKGNQITVNWTTQLPRQTSFDFHITNVNAVDDSTLEQPYDLAFTTSGGPTISGSNIPSFGLNSGQAMTMFFSQPLNTSQSLTNIVSLEVNGQTVPANVEFSGQQGIVITPQSSYPVCASVEVEVNASLESNYGVSGNSAWSATTRSHCYSTFSIGTSVQDRSITAYKFGTGPSTVLFIAAMEGNEQNSANLLEQWIPNIDANPGKIPSYRTVVVIPQINPDGYAADTRLNAAGIDLNRNFPSNNWSEQVTEPLANTTWTNDGGPNPLSAPESQALASYYESLKPRLTLTMHSHGGIVEANDAGDSIALGAEYANLADYRAIPTYLIGNFFNYTTTGAFEDWANDKLGLPVLEVELESATNDEYARNLPALWAMANVSQ